MLAGFPHSDIPRIRASLQAPRGFSHATTSFVASYCLGIHRMRLFT